MAYFPFQRGLDFHQVRVATEAAFEDFDPTTAPSETSLLEWHRELRARDKQVRSWW